MKRSQFTLFLMSLFLMLAFGCAILETPESAGENPTTPVEADNGGKGGILEEIAVESRDLPLDGFDKEFYAEADMSSMSMRNQQ